MYNTAVVILNWNGRKLLEEYLPKVIENTNPELAHVIVADNGSTDDSVVWLRNNAPQAEVISLDSNYGFAEGYNKAIKLLDYYENIVLLNSDAVPAPGWIEPLLETLSQPDVVAVQPKIKSMTEPEMFEYAGAAGGFLDKNGYPYCRGRIFNTIEKDEGQYDTPGEIFWASGAALAVKREAYEKAEGFDPLFFAHMEEIDLCWRLKLAGGIIMYEPRSVVYHLGGGSLDASSPRKTYLNFRNNLLMLYKNLPRGEKRRKKLFKRRLLDTLAWGKFLLSGKSDHASEILNAHRDFKTMKRRYRYFPSEDLLRKECKRNIVTQYYLKGRKTFNRLK